MTNQEIKGIITMFLKGIAGGFINVFLSLLVNQFTQARTDEVAINTFVLNFFVGWALFSAWLLGRADEEWKKTAEAVRKKDKEAFITEAPKRISPSIRCLYLVYSVLVLGSFHLFHYESLLVQITIHFCIGFLLVTSILVLLDLDDPIEGVINIPNIDREWIKALREHGE